jgi:hypothetical protein
VEFRGEFALGEFALRAWIVRAWIAAVLLSLAPIAASPAGARAESKVDLELALAVDASASISGGAMEFQLRGHAAAFRDERLVQAVEASGGRGIAVQLVEFSGPGSLEVLVPWTLVRDAAGARAFAGRIEAVRRPERQGSTAIGSAIDAIRPMFEGNGFEAPHRVIDVVSNGFSNGGALVEGARDRAVADGITINALAILDEYEWLESYFAESVIGGPGSFVRTAETRESFAEALVRKLIDEIVQAPLPPPGRGDLAEAAPRREG